VEIAEADELFNFPLHPYTRSLISAIPIPDPKLEKNKVLFTYDPSIHDYSEEQPQLVNIGHDHFVYGNTKEIEQYKEIRNTGVPMKSITIVDPETVEEGASVQNEIDWNSGQFTLQTPLHDTGSVWYTIGSFFLPPLGIIGGLIFKKFKHLRNAKACFKGAWIGLGVLGAIVALFGILLLSSLL
jgi:oligopeptide transport system ATP-binding protein